MTGILRAEDGFAGRGDDAYEALIRGHDGLSDDESAALNARLILILANEVGDIDKLTAAIALARETLRPPPSSAASEASRAAG